MAGVNQSQRAHMLPRVGFHAADEANMLNSAGIDAGWCKSMMHRARVPDSTGVNSA